MDRLVPALFKIVFQSRKCAVQSKSVVVPVAALAATLLVILVVIHAVALAVGLVEIRSNFYKTK